MKINQWTLGLAALGVVSLASVAQAEEQMSAVQTALSSTTISGYVDTSAQWNVGTGDGQSYYKFGSKYGTPKADGFNLNVVQLTIAKPLDEAEWAAGYRADLWFGPDANTLGTQSVSGTTGDLAIRQAYVALRMPVGNGLDWKMGVFDSIVGYESVEAGNNPNFTRSYGHTIEPQTHTGLLGTYRFSDAISTSFGIANTVGPTINGRANAPYGPMAESYKSYMGSIALTAPDSMGFLKGSSLYFGIVGGFGQSSLGGINGQGTQVSWYAGTTIATPVEGLKFGFAYDYLDSRSGSAHNAVGNGQDAWAASVYASYQATEKLSLHLRGEVGTLPGLSRYSITTITNPDTEATITTRSPLTDNTQIWALTGTVQYDLWKNVISRLEVRWDASDEGQYFSGSDGPVTQKNSVLIAANLIYKF